MITMVVPTRDRAHTLRRVAIAIFGQRVPRWQRVYWSVHHTRYFYRKFYDAYAARLCLHSPRWVALLAFAAFAVYREYLRPVPYTLAMRLLRRRRGGAAQPVVGAV